MSYSGPVTDPFRIRAPDGRTYFDVLGAPQGLVQMYSLVIQAIDKCRVEERQAQALANAEKDAQRRAVRQQIVSYWRANGLRLDKALRDFRQALDRIARETAAVADARIVNHIDQTQVRPDTSRGVRMRDSIESRAVPTRPELGIVGIARVATLNKGTRRGGKGQPFWEAQEFGTDAHVGRIVKGYFMPGRSRPSAVQFRQHPEFRRQGRGKGVPAMKIGRPIEERGFLRKGVEDAGRYRARKLKVAERKLVGHLQAVASSRPPKPPPAAPGTGRGGRRRR